MRTRLFSLLSVIIILAALPVACKVGPDYHRPAGQSPAQWADVPPDAATSPTQELTRWWTTFDDPQLTSLIERAAQANLDLRMAESRVRQARAQRQATAGALWPALSAGAGVTRRESSENIVSDQTKAFDMATAGVTGVMPDISRKSDLYQAGFDASWEIDVFGGNRRALEAARAAEEAAQESRNSVLVSLLGEVARNYVDLRGLQRQAALTEANQQAQQETYELTLARFNAGVVSDLDVQRARTQSESTRAQLPLIQKEAAQTEHRLAVLLGLAPGALSAEFNPARPIPTPSATLAIGLPSDLLRRRPDIRGAERELAAATARVGVAVADLYPRFTLSGGLGQQSLEPGDFLKGTSSYWSWGPSVRWPVFQGGALRANVRLNKERQNEALTQYERTILGAFEDVENAYVGYAAERDRHQSLVNAADSAQQSVEIAKAQYDKGLGDFLNVLDAQRALYATQLALARNEAAISTGLVGLYKAAGGGWEASAPGATPGKLSKP